MPTATGSIERSGNSGTNFTGKFNIAGIPHRVTGTFGAGVRRFRSANVTIAYTSVDDLVANRPFEGTIGVDTIDLNIDGNMAAVTGRLDDPISPPSAVSGLIVFAQG